MSKIFPDGHFGGKNDVWTSVLIVVNTNKARDIGNVDPPRRLQWCLLLDEALEALKHRKRHKNAKGQSHDHSNKKRNDDDDCTY